MRFLLLVLFGTVLIVPGVALAQDAVTDCNCSVGKDGALTTGGNGITIGTDGDMTDWDLAVLPDPDNNICDAPAEDATNPDLDTNAPSSNGRDIRHFAFTWDEPVSGSSQVKFFTERNGASSNTQNFAFYADLDSDGRQEANEPVIGVEWQGNNRTVVVKVYNYNPVDTIDGDCLEDSPACDGSGSADGYSPPGTLSGGVCSSAPQFDNVKCQADTGSTSGLQMEFAVTWSDLNQAPGVPILFHGSTSNANLTANSWPSQIDDNIGGCGGALGSLQSYAVTCTTHGEVSGEHGEVLDVAHTIVNDGNGDDLFDLDDSLTPHDSHSGAVSPAIAYYRDVNENGGFDSGTDVALTDTDGDGLLDTGTITAGEAVHFIARYIVGDVRPYDPAGVATNAIDVISDNGPDATDNCTDTVTVILTAELSVTKVVHVDSDPLGGTNFEVPGSVMRYTVTVTNLGGGTTATDTVFVTDGIPVAKGDLFVGDMAGAGSGPVNFDPNTGAFASGLSYNFSTLADTGDDIEFSDDGGSTWSYAPAPDGGGFDSEVTHFRINPTGDMNGMTALTDPGGPSFTIRYKMRVH